MWWKTDVSHIKTRDVIVDGKWTLIFTCPECGHEGWCYPEQATGNISIICNGTLPNGQPCKWHETHNLMNHFFTQQQQEAWQRYVGRAQNLPGTGSENEERLLRETAEVSS